MGKDQENCTAVPWVALAAYIYYYICLYMYVSDLSMTVLEYSGI